MEAQLELTPEYLAGLFDGCGIVYTTHLQFNNTNLEILFDIEEAYGGTISDNGSSVYRTGKRRTFWVNRDKREYGYVYTGVELAELMLPFAIVQHDKLQAYVAKRRGEEPELHTTSSMNDAEREMVEVLKELQTATDGVHIRRLRQRLVDLNHEFQEPEDA
jgi:hypothetical protein